jgi:hypothetical protein
LEDFDNVCGMWALVRQHAISAALLADDLVADLESGAFDDAELRAARFDAAFSRLIAAANKAARPPKES